MSDALDPILVHAFGELVDWFRRGDDKSRHWNQSDELTRVLHELQDLRHWWSRMRPGRTPARSKDETVAYHRIDSDQLIKLIRVREFLRSPQLMAPMYPLAKLSEMPFIQFSTDDLASEVCCRGTVASAVVVSQDGQTGPDSYDIRFWCRGDTPLNKVKAANELLKYVTTVAENAGVPAAEIDEALGIRDADDDDEDDKGF